VATAGAVSGTLFQRSVRDSAELQRILELPKREITDEFAASLVDEWSGYLTTDAGWARGARLKPEQAVVCREVQLVGGVWCALPVGVGKSLLSWVVPTILDAKRPVIVLPSGLREELQLEWATYSRDFVPPRPPPRMISFNELDQVDGLTLLERIDPDVLMLDESHKTRRPKRAARVRIARWIAEKWEAFYAGKGPRPHVCQWTGTPGRLSILDFSHSLIWSLGEGAPVPIPDTEQKDWASALDEKGPRQAERRQGVGALRRLIVDMAVPETGTLLRDARVAFRERLKVTPGVVIFAKDSCKQPLTIEQIVPPFDPVIEGHFEQFRKYNMTPGGESAGDPLQQFQLEGQLSVGYHGIWDPEPGPLWRTARKTFHDECQEIIRDSQDDFHPLDTMGAVARAYPDLTSLVEWNKIKGTYTIDPKPVWNSGSVVEWVAGLLRDGPPTMCFCWSIPLLEALEYVTGLTWYANKGLDRQGRYIRTAPADKSALVSGGANLEGRNLQHFSEFLYLVPPQSAQWLEQAFGRGHRQNQTKPVRIRIAITSGGIADGFESALREALFASDTWGVKQKILRARIERAEYDRTSYRFSRRKPDTEIPEDIPTETVPKSTWTPEPEDEDT
jgi:hypothetical protein